MPLPEEIHEKDLLALFRDQFIRWGFSPEDTDEVLVRLADVIDYERGWGEPGRSRAASEQVKRYSEVLLEFFEMTPEAAFSIGEALHLWEVLSAAKIVPPEGVDLFERTGRLPQRKSKSFLVLATEWDPHHGGLSTFNQRLCKSLAENGHNVICYVGSASQVEIGSALHSGVNLIVAPAVPTVPAKFRVMLASDSLPADSPDFIIGHDRQTGAAALVLGSRFPNAKLILFAHTAPRLIEWHKNDRKDTETLGRSANERLQEQAQLFAQADFVVAGGTALLQEANHALLPNTRRKNSKKVQSVPFFPGFAINDDYDLGTAPRNLLFVGRAEDTYLKGLDIINEAVQRNRRDHQIQLDCTLLGADVGTEYDLKKSFPSFTNIIAYDPSREKLHEELARADLLLMPSRQEGFGLVAIEAIECNRPFLVSDQSGFAQYIRTIAANCSGSAKALIENLIVNVEVDRPGEELAEKIRWIFANWGAVVSLVDELRSELQKPVYSWKAATAALVERLKNLDPSTK
jgi:glycosyltransferase involved in cell wall biosynthesis